ncbi:MAG: MFS transporter [Candidatus Bathyarchaeota archaeon]|nr:MAG: MFS transporter [Candidatus Bathyarchaeota archaeon]
MIRESGLFSRNLIILTISNILWMFSIVLAETYLSLYILRQGGTVATVGLIGSIAYLAGIPLYPVGGYISDYKGRVKLIGLMTYFYVSTSLIFAFAESWVTIAVGAFLQNSVLFYFPSLFAIQIESVPSNRRGIGFAMITAIPRACGIAAPFVAGYIVSLYGIVPGVKLLYGLTFIVGIFVASLRLFGLEETVTPAKHSVPISNLPLLVLESYKRFIGALKNMSKSLTSFTLVTILITFFAAAAEPYYILYFSTIIGLTHFEWGQLSFIASLISFTLAIPIGKLTDMYGGRKTTILSVIAAIPSFSFIFCDSFAKALLFITYFSIVNTFMISAFRVMVAGLIPSDKRGLVLSALGSRSISIRLRGANPLGGGVLTFVAGMISIPLGAYLYNINPTFPFLFLSSGLILCFLLIYKFIHDQN